MLQACCFGCLLSVDGMWWFVDVTGCVWKQRGGDWRDPIPSCVYALFGVLSGKEAESAVVTWNASILDWWMVPDGLPSSPFWDGWRKWLGFLASPFIFDFIFSFDLPYLLWKLSALLFFCSLSCVSSSPPRWWLRRRLWEPVRPSHSMKSKCWCCIVMRSDDNKNFQVAFKTTKALESYKNAL